MRGSSGRTETGGGCRTVWAVLGSPQRWSSGFAESPFLPKQRKQGGSARAWPVAAPIPKLDSFYGEEKVDAFSGIQICIKLFAYLSLLGRPCIYSVYRS